MSQNNSQYLTVNHRRDIADIFNQRSGSGRRICMLMLTHACNLHCSYCYEKYKSSKTMSETIAKKAILDELQYVREHQEFTELEIDFMGGEPMLQFTLIKKLVDWFPTVNKDIPYIFFASTNGTLVHDEIREWLKIHHREIVLSISYDGDAEMQNVNRGKVATMVDTNFFYETWPYQPVKMTISKESLPRLAQGIIELHKIGIPVSPSLAQGVDWTQDDSISFFIELQKIKEFYLTNPEVEPCDLLVRPLYQIGEKNVEQSKYCGAGSHMITYDTDGRKYACQMFTPLVLGDKCLSEDNVNDFCVIQTKDPECHDCIYKAWCPTCSGFNYRDRGAHHLRDHSWCAMIKAQVQVTVEFQLEYYYNRISQGNEYDVSMLASARKVYDILNADPELYMIMQ